MRDHAKLQLYFDKLPLNNTLSDLNDGPDCIVDVDFIKIYSSVFDELSKVFINDKIRKQKSDCLRALYLYSSYKIYGAVRFTKKHINDLKRYYKSNQDNVTVGCVIFDMECEMKLFTNAYLTYMDMLGRFVDLEDEFLHCSTVIENCSDGDFEIIFTDICQKIDSNYDMDMSLFVTEILDPVISRLWNIDDKKRNFQKITEIPERLSFMQLEKSDKLFEMAYSFAEVKSSKAKVLYEMLLKREPNNSATLNNLGVIFEKEGNLVKAKEHFNRACEINNTEEIYSRNYKRVNSSLIKFSTALDKVKNEPVWFIGRLSMLYDMANDVGEVQCTYKNRSTVLKVRPEKANELVDKMLESGI